VELDKVLKEQRAENVRMREEFERMNEAVNRKIG